MSSVHETVYPGFKSQITTQKLESFYTPITCGMPIRSASSTVETAPSSVAVITENQPMLGVFCQIGRNPARHTPAHRLYHIELQLIPRQWKEILA